MMKAALFATFTLCSTQVSLGTASGVPEATCTSGNVTVTKVSKIGKIAISCPTGYEGVLTADGHPGQTAVCLTPDPDKNDVQPICEACPGAGCTTEGGKVILQIAQLPSSVSTFYFQCTPPFLSSGDKKACFVGIEVAASNRLGPNTCAANGKRINFSVEAAKETVTFACGDGKTLTPSDKTKAFDRACTSETPLVEGATLTEADKTFQLKVETLPRDPTEICYVCVEKGKDGPESKCEIHIAIAGSKGSGALGVAARTSAALGVTLVAVGFLRV